MSLVINSKDLYYIAGVSQNQLDRLKEYLIGTQRTPSQSHHPNILLLVAKRK